MEEYGTLQSKSTGAERVSCFSLGPLGRYTLCLAVLDVSCCTALFLISANEVSDKQAFWDANFSKYDFTTALFDVVLLAAARAIALVVVYSLLKYIHWSTIVVVFGTSVAFCVAKFILFEGLESAKWLPTILLIFTLVFPSAELWLWISKQVPQLRFLLAQKGGLVDYDDFRHSERERLLSASNFSDPYGAVDASSHGGYATDRPTVLGSGIGNGIGVITPVAAGNRDTPHTKPKPAARTPRVIASGGGGGDIQHQPSFDSDSLVSSSPSNTSAVTSSSYSSASNNYYAKPSSLQHHRRVPSSDFHTPTEDHFLHKANLHAHRQRANSVGSDAETDSTGSTDRPTRSSKEQQQQQQQQRHDAPVATRPKSEQPPAAKTKSKSVDNIAALDADTESSRKAGPKASNPTSAPDARSQRSLTLSTSSILAAASEDTPTGIRTALVLALEKVRKDALDTFMWEFVSEADGVTVYHNKATPSIKQMKGVAILPFPPRVILEYILKHEKQRRWNSSIEQIEQIDSLDDRCQLLYMRWKTTWPVKPRDFVCVQGWVEHATVGDGYVTATQSVVSSKVPEIQDYIRGEVLHSGFVIEPLASDLNSCMVIHVVAVDLKGWIPPNIASRGLMDRPLVLASLRRAIEEDEEASEQQANEGANQGWVGGSSNYSAAASTSASAADALPPPLISVGKRMGTLSPTPAAKEGGSPGAPE